jgi:hypothetical protein
MGETINGHGLFLHCRDDLTNRTTSLLFIKK